MPLKVFTTFSGYDSQLLALRRIAVDFDCIGWSEIEPNAIKAHNAIFPEYADLNYGDICKIDWNAVPDFDLLTYSSPCFVAGTLVNTKRGIIPIEEVRVGDMVLTHTNRYQRVLRTGFKVSDELYKLKGMAFDEIVCTGNHPFYVRRMSHKGHKSIRTFDNPEWLQAKELNTKTYCGVAINQESELPKWDGSIDNRWGHHKTVNTLSEKFKNPDFWYLMGRYVGDGWVKKSKTGNGVVICCGGRNEQRLQSAFNNAGMKAHFYKEETVTKYVVCSNELCQFVTRYGYYAHGKVVDAETMALPYELLKAFVDGYTESDGCYLEKQKLYKYTTVSRRLVYGIAQCIAKVYNRPYSVYFTKRPKNTEIEGRVVNQRDSLEVRFKKEISKQDHAFIEGEIIWFPINKVEKLSGTTATVYNLEVENDNSYTANGVVVHNCQDFSIAGLRQGGEQGSGTRSSLLWECERAIAAKRPKYLLMENVPALTTKTFMPLLRRWLDTLTHYGYTNYAKCLNAKDYGVPQSRNRLFVVSTLGKEPFFFPKKKRLEKRLCHVLEVDGVSENFYYTDAQLEGRFASKYKMRKYVQDAYGDKISRCITAHEGNEPLLLKVNEPQIQCVGSIANMNAHESTHRVYSPDGISPTLNCCEGGNLQPKILCKQQGDRIRRLTPRECFRLMDVDDIYIDRIQAAGISNSQQYKLAGNSIVVAVLANIFRKMFVNRESETQQRELF